MMEFLGAVRAHVDQERDSLGFWPPQVYLDAARRGELLVATVDGNPPGYRVHLLIGYSFPQMKIYQIYVCSAFRRKGLARQLICTALRIAGDNNHRSVSARVAGDLEANKFWAKLGFRVVRVVEGRATTHRKINVRGERQWRRGCKALRVAGAGAARRAGNELEYQHLTISERGRLGEPCAGPRKWTGDNSYGR
jgi:GNAT superfamily N-acetyltransferase